MAEKNKKISHHKTEHKGYFPLVLLFQSLCCSTLDIKNNKIGILLCNIALEQLL